MDGGGGTIGRVHDVVLLPVVGGEPPHALGLVVQLRRRRLIFVSFGRVGEIGSEGARLVGGTVDLGGFTAHPGEILASSLYGKEVSAGTVADIAIAPRETRRSGWEVSTVAISRGRGFLSGGPAIVPWDQCRELFTAPLDGQVAQLREMRPADLATAFGDFTPARRSQVADALDDSELADVLEEMPEEDSARLVTSLALERGADVIEEMQPDDAADLLARLPAEDRERLLKAMRGDQAEEVRRLLAYDAATAGGLMTSQPLIFGPQAPVAEVLAKIRNSQVAATEAAQVYVCEPPLETPTGTYLGSVGFQRLLRRPPSTPIGEVIESRTFIRPDLPERELAARLAAYNLIGVAVCDEAGHLLGAVTVDDVLDHLLPPGWRRTRTGV
jgi:CBS domain-containing protein